MPTIGGGVDDGLVAEGTSTTLLSVGGGSSFRSAIRFDVLRSGGRAEVGAIVGGVGCSGGVP